MKWIRSLKSRVSILNELFRFLWSQRLWWLIPLVMVLVIFGVLLLIAQSSPIAPFVYTLF